jgi:uncharacterized membrane protein YphA (DoxX/SURF4 family)
MKNPLASEMSTNLGILVARLALGASLLMAGYAHFSGAGGIKAFANSNVGNLPRWMPGEAAAGYSQVLPFVEMAAGGMLVLGLTTRVGGVLAAVVYGVVLSARGIHLHPHPEEHLPVYLAVAFLLLCLGGGKLTVDGVLFQKKKKPEGPTGGH